MARALFGAREARARGVQAGCIAKIRTPSKLVAEQSGDVEKDDHDDWHAEQPENDAFHESLQLAPPLKNDSSLAEFHGLQWLMSTRDSRRAAALDHHEGGLPVMMASCICHQVGN